MKSNVDNPFIATSAEITTQTDVTASRAIDGTVYHNIGSKPIFVNITIQHAANGGDVIAKSDANVVPNLIVAETYDGAISVIVTMLTFIVLPGNYYEATATGGSSMKTWIEYT
jgi:hypothetical protein